MANRLILARKSAGYETATEGAARCGVSISSYIHHENGTRNYPSSKAAVYARAYQVNVNWLLFGTGTMTGIQPPHLEPVGNNEGLPIQYIVQAGAWYENGDNHELIGRAQFAPDKRFASDQQWAEKVHGDSLDKLFPEGSILHIVSAIGSGLEIKDKALVVVERERHGLRERTVKRITKDENGKRILIGESNNPKWNVPLDLELKCSEFESAQIVGIVIGGYRPMEI